MSLSPMQSSRKYVYYSGDPGCPMYTFDEKQLDEEAPPPYRRSHSRESLPPYPIQRVDEVLSCSSLSATKNSPSSTMACIEQSKTSTPILPSMSYHSITTPSYAAIGSTKGPFYNTNPESDPKAVPFRIFQMMCNLYSGQQDVMPEFNIGASGFFSHEGGHWVMFRRNYFAVECKYRLVNALPGQLLHVEIPDSHGTPRRLQVQALAVRITAMLSDFRGEEVELKQYTSKRDRGPIDEVKHIKLSPQQNCTIKNPDLPSQNSAEYVAPSSGCFERIQFRSATRNNNARKKNQELVRLVVGLYGDLNEYGEGRSNWVKIAHQVSDEIEVRGRGPKHYRQRRITQRCTAA